MADESSSDSYSEPDFGYEPDSPVSGVGQTLDEPSDSEQSEVSSLSDDSGFDANPGQTAGQEKEFDEFLK